MSVRRALTVVGMGDDGCVGLSSQAASTIAEADVLVGGERHLAFFPQFRGEKIVLKESLGRTLDRVAELCNEQQVCVLASGDPLFFGVGALIVKKVGREHVRFLPHPSSVQLAFARVGISWEDATLLSFHGRSAEGFLTRLRSTKKAACLTDATHSPSTLAAHMLAHGQTEFRAWVCENLGSTDERVRAFSIEELAACEDVGPLNVLLLERAQADFVAPTTMPFLHEDAFAKRMPKKGLITKREVRLLSLASLSIRPNSVVWDIGAGSGSVAIEAALLAPLGRAYAIEVDPEGAAICRDNCRTMAVDNVRVVLGRAPEILSDLEDPDAVFVGGSKGSMRDIVEVSLARLRPGGRLVVNAITLENVGEAYALFRERGIVPEVTLLQVSRGEPLAHYLRYEALNPIHIFAISKPDPNEKST